jgi:NaMN:DMB phosphoribosyltransferase
MQPYRLTVDKFLDHAARWFGEVEVVEAVAGCVAGRTTYAELRDRSNRLSGALAALGVTPLLDLGMRLGEGTGALLALPVVTAAARALHDVATFDAAGVVDKTGG